MRRTYKSKKDSGDGLDRRDLFQTVGDKSSIFDAFYIQNIKQAKRDLSREVSSNRKTAASHKVFKRKYIKRLGKDIQPVIKESLSPLAFLTPDKSIRVNKGLDLFDQLLNTSSQPLDTPQIRRQDSLYINKSKTKKYERKKVPKKKYNYSDSDETDKENSSINENALQNTTDVRAHKLFIEKRNSCQIKLDESIKKIEQNLFMLQKNNRESMTKFKQLINKNRLTTNMDSPKDRNSPLSSTPFTGKFRNKSIYKFSPIKFDLDKSNCTATTEYIDRFDSVFKEKDHYKISENFQNSPILQSSKQKTLKYKVNNTKNDSFIDECENNIDYVIQQSSSQITKTEACLSSRTNKDTNYDINEIPLTDKNIIQNDVSENHVNINDNENVPNNNSDYISIINNEVTKRPTSSSSSDNNDLKDFVNNVSIDNVTIGDDSVPSQAFLGFTKIETDIINKSYEDDTTKETEMTKSIIEQILNNSAETVNETCSFDYDTCNSEVSLDTGVFIKKPVVTIKKLSESIFKQYYEKYTQDSCSDTENSLNKSPVSTQPMPKELSSDVENFEDSNSVENYKFNDSAEISIESNWHGDTKIETSELQLNTKNVSIPEEITSSEEDYLDSTSNEEEERCFVTTRKRNDFTGDCVALESSCVCSSSAEFEKTVLGQLKNDKKHSSINQDVELSDGECSQISVKENSVMKRNSFSTTNYAESRKTLINRGESSRLTESIDICKMKEEYRKTEVKPSIMLLPGKKWQRSLSIYRRISMMVDQSDQSIFEDETLNKGRKYRQSVIDTIELQETIGSLNNSTIDSRRNTFVSKPCRSSIRIVKESYIPRVSLHSSSLFEDLEGFLSEDCDDTVIELSKLSIAEREKDSVLNKVHDSLDRIPTARDYVFRRCNQTAEILFDECYPDTVLKNCRKIGEGVYGEVFLWRANDGRARVMKIVPIAGTTKVNGEPQKDYHEILSEIVIAMELSALRTPIAAIERHLDEGNDVETLDLHTVENATDVFNEVLAVRCVYGPYPSRLLDLWDLFDEVKGSENECPATLPADQHYLVLELANAGQDLESFVFNSAEQAYALFVQIAFGLAVAEEAYQFEHRDLHWGNVLISPTDQKVATFVLRCRVYRVARRGVAGAVIDYSLSRLALRQGALYNDLADDHSLFEAAGDYQFEVYRLMRDKLGNDWKNFEPYTNILWLHYTVDKMITSLRYKRTNTKIHKQYINKLKGIKNRILDYGSAAIFVLTDNELLC